MKSPRRRSQSGTAGAAMRRERESRSPRAHERERGGRHPSPALSPSLLLALSPPLRRSFLAFEGDKGFRRRPARSRAFPSLRIRPEPAPAHAIQLVFATAQDPSRARSATGRVPLGGRRFAKKYRKLRPTKGGKRNQIAHQLLPRSSRRPNCSSAPANVVSAPISAKMGGGGDRDSREAERGRRPQPRKKKTPEKTPERGSVCGGRGW